MLSKDEILKRTNNGLEVFRHYLRGQGASGATFEPVLRRVPSPCNIYFDRHSGSYRMKDFRNEEYAAIASRL